MFCINCGTEIAKDSSFCTNCGNKLTTTPPPLHEPTDKNSNKKKLTIILIIAGVVLVIALSILIIVLFMKNIKNRFGWDDKSQTTAIEETLDSSQELDDDQVDNNEESFDISIDDELEDYDVQIEDEYDTEDKDTSEYTYDPIYSYSELPDVLSIDYNTRFTFYDYFELNNSYVYSFQFNDANATEEDFIKACEDYKLLLEESYGFTYMQEVSDQHYAETGKLNYYLLRDDYELGITPSNEEGYFFAYISIQSYSMVAGGNEIIDELDMANFKHFIANRNSISVTINKTINMDNGLSFYIHEVMGNYTEDGDVVIDVVIDISSYYPDYYFNNGDFLLLPLDSNGNILSDAVPVNIVHDESGNEVTMPFLLSASSYDTYTFYFPVPAETYSLLLYATNVLVDDYSYPVYVMRVGE